MITTPFLLTLSLPALADPADIGDAMRRHDAHSSHPLPAVSLVDQQRLDRGETVKLRLSDPAGGPITALGMVVTDVSRQDVWMGSMDPHGKPPSDMTITFLPRVGGELFRWYGFVDLPVPFDDRHFLIRTSIDEVLAAATGGSMWERTWNLEGDWSQVVQPLVDQGKVAGVDRRRFESAVQTPVNEGAWTVLELGDGRTLLAYQVATALGGDIPDAAVTRYLYWTLEGVLEQVVADARLMASHYVSGHEPLIGGDGREIAAY